MKCRKFSFKNCRDHAYFVLSHLKQNRVILLKINKQTENDFYKNSNIYVSLEKLFNKDFPRAPRLAFCLFTCSY